MKTKFNLITDDKNVEFYLVRETDKRLKKGYFTAIYEGKEYPQVPNGTLLEFNNTKRVVDDRVSVIALEGHYLLIVDNGKYAGPKIQCLTNCKVKCNSIANNFRASFNLLLVFIIILIIVLICGIAGLTVN